MRDIFVSYRRDDVQGHAGRLWDRLKTAFGEDCVFNDQRDIDPGEEWSERIDGALHGAQVSVGLIGPNSQSAKPQGSAAGQDVPAP